MTPRVLHVITGLGHGGAERQLLALLRHLPVPCEVAVLTGPYTLAEPIEALGIPVHRLAMRGNRDLTALPALVRVIRQGRFDIVHTHLYRAGVFGRLAARLAGVRGVVATEHSLGEGHLEGRATGPAVRLLYQASERLGRVTVAVSPTVAARLDDWGVPSARVVTIPNGIDAAAFRFDPLRRARVRRRWGLDKRDFVVGTVGRLVPTKRTEVLIGALEHAATARLVVVGDGPRRRELERLAARSPAASRILFAGDTDDVPGALSALDVFAAPSVQETFGLSVLEALASGLPVLYTACPALQDLPADHAEGALRVPSSPDAYGEAIGRFARRPPGRLAPPAAVDRYSIDAVADRMTRLYRAIAAPTTAAAPRASSPRPTR
ncbi:glycosyltransferase [Actinomadura kijaniata]|uniref:glycosyltransferase n=1 Tax=Actinomadura kijaniata TaxID=46161 RepID=UPI003F1E4402